MPIFESFNSFESNAAATSFLREGFVTVEVENRDGLDRLKALVAHSAREYLGVSSPGDDDQLLNEIHAHIDVSVLNELRLAIIHSLRAASWFRPTYYSLARIALNHIVGNELAMQKGIGLSVQLPHDDSSLLPIHSDVWDGDSPFEVVVWVPLVNCYRSKSMFILPLKTDRARQADVATYQTGGAEALFEAIAEDAVFVDVPYGSVLIFSQTLMHGNRVNRERETRWSMNCRFKSAMSPYADKKLGEFFEPISLRPASRIGLTYELPGGFNE